MVSSLGRMIQPHGEFPREDDATLIRIRAALGVYDREAFAFEVKAIDSTRPKRFSRESIFRLQWAVSGR